MHNNKACQKAYAVVPWASLTFQCQIIILFYLKNPLSNYKIF
jgi:hypothetical protein